MSGLGSAFAARGDIPAAVKDMANDVYEIWFDTGQLNGAPPASIFNQAPPIWQELNFAICGNGKLLNAVSSGQRPLRLGCASGSRAAGGTVSAEVKRRLTS